MPEQVQPEQSIGEKVFDLGNGLSIWKAPLEAMREQDLNARVMDQPKFKKLVEQIKRDQRLETLPLVALKVGKSGRKELSIISGHHRTRAARAAGLVDIYVMAFTDELKDDFVRAKQLAHNSIQGKDDTQKLKEIYDLIGDVEAKIQAAIDDIDLATKYECAGFKNITLPIDFEMVNLVFLPHQKAQFDDVMKLLTAESGEDVKVVDLESFAKFKAACRTVAKVENIRNVTTIMDRMCEIVMEVLTEKANAKESGKKE